MKCVVLSLVVTTVWWSAAVAAGPWRTSAQVFKRSSRDGSWSRPNGTLRRFNPSPRKNRDHVGHRVPRINGQHYSRRQEHRGQVVLAEPIDARPSPHTTKLVHERDVVAVPVHSEYLNVSLRGGSLFGLTAPVGRPGKGVDATLRFLLVETSYRGGKPTLITVKEADGEPRRFEIIKSALSLQYMHSTRAMPWGGIAFVVEGPSIRD